jgi:hypothetical protein
MPKCSSTAKSLFSKKEKVVWEAKCRRLHVKPNAVLVGPEKRGDVYQEGQLANHANW